MKSVGEFLYSKFKGTDLDPASCKYIFTDLRLPQGYYENPGDIIDQIVRDFKHVMLPYETPVRVKEAETRSDLPLYYQYEKNERTIKVEGPIAYLFINANKILNGLGLVNPLHTIDGDENNKICTGGLYGRFGKMPGLIDTLYLYSDLFEVNCVGDEKVNFVTVVPVDGEYASASHYAPAKPEYKKVRHNTIKSIELQISDCFGEDIQFNSNSETIAMFHFKRTERLD